jgi:hypothetical protein
LNMGIQIIKSFAFCVIIVPVTLGAQDDYYPPESFYGGGVGFSQMFLFQNLGQLEGFGMLGSVGDTAGFGFDLTKFANPFMINGGEGFSNITERIRIGGYAGFGSSLLLRNLTSPCFLIQMGMARMIPVKRKRFFRNHLTSKLRFPCGLVVQPLNTCFRFFEVLKYP